MLIHHHQTQTKIEYPDEAFFKGVWGEMVETAERHNDPGKFSAFSGYEWTSMIDGDNMHRVVIFRDGAEKTLGAIPVSSTENNDPEYLWERLEDYEKKTGGEVLAIPHNSNLSEGGCIPESVFPAHHSTRNTPTLVSDGSQFLK